MDVLICDSAGRLQTKVNLMNELTKMRKVLGKSRRRTTRNACDRCYYWPKWSLTRQRVLLMQPGVDSIILK